MHVLKTRNDQCNIKHFTLKSVHARASLYCSLVFVQFSCSLIWTKSHRPSIISACRMCVWRTWNMTWEESFNGTRGRANHYRSVRIWAEVLVQKTGVVCKLQTNVSVVRVIKLCCVNSYFIVFYLFYFILGVHVSDCVSQIESHVWESSVISVLRWM